MRRSQACLEQQVGPIGADMGITSIMDMATTGIMAIMAITAITATTATTAITATVTTMTTATICGPVPSVGVAVAAGSIAWPCVAARAGAVLAGEGAVAGSSARAIYA